MSITLTPAQILLQADRCIRCGNCLAVCPVSLTAKADIFPGPRHVGGDIPRPTHEFEANVDVVFLCTACNACGQVCPGEIAIDEVMREIRCKIVESGRFPQKLIDALESTVKYGNPWGLPRNDRSKWSEGFPIKDFSKGDGKAEILLFVGCTASYDTRVQEVTKSLAKILMEAKVDFGILGTYENCCGDPVRWIGEIGLFEELKEKNKELFEKYAVSRIVTISPHCYDAFKSYYNLKGVEVQHYTEFLYELLHGKKIAPCKKIIRRVTYQDPCILGRKHKVFDKPREILKAIPGVNLVEMERIKEESFCCGGGAGRVWLEIPVRERLSMPRLNEAKRTNPDTLTTSCPFCLIMLDDAVRVAGEEERIKVKDITELLVESL